MSNFVDKLGDQPYYFEIIPRTIISKSSQKQQGQFRFHVYKTTQQVDFTKQAIIADFNQRKMQVKNVKLNFFLPNYISGSHINSKFIFQLSKKTKYSQQRQAGRYVIDPKIYVQEFKRIQKNHYAQLWQLSDIYSVQIQIFFEESRYMLQKVLKQYRNVSATVFNKPLVSKALQKARKDQIQEDQQFDNEQKYKQKRLDLLNKYEGAIIGQGGYRIFNQQERNINKKQPQKLIRQNENKRSLPQQQKNLINKARVPQNQKSLKEQTPQKPNLKRTESITMNNSLQEDFSQTEIKNIKYLIILIVIFILAGSGYFLSKIFLKEQNPSINDQNQTAHDEKPRMNGSKQKKSKSSTTKGPKKSKNSQQL